jgi:spermidine synthase
MRARTLAKVCYFLFFVSGLSSLLYEVVWSKLLTLLFGSTVFAVSTVTSALFAGLALGSFWFGRWVDRRGGHALAIYAGLEIAIAAFALLLPTVLSVLEPFVDAVHRSTHGTFYTLSLLRFALVFAVLFVPTTLMGGTLPVLAKFFGARARSLSVGEEVGRLYTLNTLGAVVGTLLAGFVLIERLGVRKTTWFAVLLNLTVGLAAFVMSRRMVTDAEDGAAPDAPLAEPTPDAPAEAAPSRLVLLAFALSGFASLAYEILSIRSLLYVLPYGYNTIYVFTTVLVVFLGGIAIGSALVTRTLDGVKSPLATLTWIEILLAAYVAATPHLLAWIVEPTSFFRGTIGSGRFVDAFLKTILTLLVPTILMGATFPLAARIYGRAKSSLGSDIGRLYAVNTVGSIFGSFAAGFVMIPLGGVQRGFLVTAFFNLAAGLLVYTTWAPDRRRARLVSGAVAALVALVVIVAPRPSIEGKEDTAKILYAKEGAASTIVVRAEPDGSRSIQTNEFIAAGTSYIFLRNQRMMGDLPLLVHKDPHKALVICFGTGTTSGALLQHPGIENVTIVEIDADIFGAARYFEDANHHVIDNPRVTRHVDDGRNFVRYTDERFDIITSEPLHPKRAGTVNLYSEDYYRLAKARLAPGGVLAQWLPLHAFQPDEFKSVARAFKNVFPHTYLWLGQQMILIGSLEKLVIDFDTLAARMAAPLLAKDLAEVDFTSPYDVLAGFFMAEDAVDVWLGGAPTITDDLPTIEYSKDMASSNLYPEMRARQSSILPHVARGASFDQAAFDAYARRFDRMLEAKGFYMEGDELRANLAMKAAEDAVPGDRYLVRLREWCGGGKCALREGTHQTP